MSKPEIKTHCKFDQMISVKELKNHDRNRNIHPKDQINRLAELYKYHGIRHPIIVSTLSGMIVAGHGRKLAAIKAGIDLFPVVFQDFINDDAEYAFLIADNSIASWSELDLSAINYDITDLGPDFDINMLGIKSFEIELADKQKKPKDESKNIISFNVTPDQAEIIEHALSIADNGNSEYNETENGELLTTICEVYINKYGTT